MGAFKNLAVEFEEEASKIKPGLLDWARPLSEPDEFGGLEELVGNGTVPGDERLRSELAQQKYPNRRWRFFEEMPDTQPEWLVDRILQRGAYAILYGASGAGKSFAAIDLAAAVASGEPFMGRSVQQGLCIYVSREGLSSLKSRIGAACRKRAHATGYPLLVHIEDCPSFTGDEAVEVLLDAVAEVENTTPHRVVLIIIDTITDYADGIEENSSDSWRPVIDRLRTIAKQIRASVLCVHHAGRSGNERGSITFRDKSDTVIRVTGNPALREGSIKIDKNKDGPTGEEAKFKLVGEPLTVQWEALKSPSSPEKPALSADLRLVDLIRAEPGLNQSALKKKSGLKPSTLQNRLEQLLKAGLIVKEKGSKNSTLYRPAPPAEAA